MTAKRNARKRKKGLFSLKDRVKAAQKGQKTRRKGEAARHTGTALAKTLLAQDHSPREVTVLLHELGVPKRHARAATLRAQAAREKRNQTHATREAGVELALRRLEQKLDALEKVHALERQLGEISEKLGQKDERVARELRKVTRAMGELHGKMPTGPAQPDEVTMKLLKLKVIEERIKKQKTQAGKRTPKKSNVLDGYRSA